VSWLTSGTITLHRSAPPSRHSLAHLNSHILQTPARHFTTARLKIKLLFHFVDEQERQVPDEGTSSICSMIDAQNLIERREEEEPGKVRENRYFACFGCSPRAAVLRRDRHRVKSGYCSRDALRHFSLGSPPFWGGRGPDTIIIKFLAAHAGLRRGLRLGLSFFLCLFL